MSLAVTACASAAPARYPLRGPMWVDPDRQPFSPAPEERYVSWAWDAADNTVFRQLAELWLYEEPRPAINVNSMDEVPDSSWFTNRIGTTALTPEQVAEGACAGITDASPPWTVVAPKAEGTLPGFIIEDAEGRRYLFKIDFQQPERPTAAEAIGTRMFWAVGYNTPCNRVVSFMPDYFRIAPGVRRRSYGDELMRWIDVEEVLAQAMRMPDGQSRGSLSLYVEGDPLGGWYFEGTRDDDPNDVIPHQHRRETRGMYVLSAWLNHVDSRAENNLDTWITVDGSRGYVRHYVLDVGDAFGVLWPVSDAMSRRFGNSHYLDLEHMLGDLVSLGFADRRYNDQFGVMPDPIFGYYRVEGFEPDQWRNGYPNPAFERRDEHDTAWMARIISRFTEEHLHAIVASGRFSRPSDAQKLVRILRGRQRRILERYLTRLSPLTFPTVVEDGSRLCLRDLAVESGIRSAEARRDRAVTWLDWPEEASRRRVDVYREGSRVCVPLPPRAEEAEGPRYLVVEVTVATIGQEVTGAAQVHVVQLAPGRVRIVGLRRLPP